MASWRDTTSLEAQDDLDGLLNAVLPYAERTLAEHGELHPFAAGVSADGQIAMLVADTDQRTQPDPIAALNDLVRRAREASGSGRAAAFVANGSTEAGDALRVELEHREGIALVVLVPYSIGRKQDVKLGESTTEDGDVRIWTAS